MGGYYRIIRSLEKRPKRKGREEYEEKFFKENAGIVRSCGSDSDFCAWGICRGD